MKGIELQIVGSRPTSLGGILSSHASSSADVLDELIVAVKKMHVSYFLICSMGSHHFFLGGGDPY